MEISKSYSNLLKYLLLGTLGLLIIIVSSLIQDVAIPKEQQDFTHFLNYNYTKPVGIIFFITGLLSGFLLKLNPWKIGISLFLVFPITVIIEIIIDETSHNLLPFELIMYFFYTLPSILAAFIGKYIAQQMSKQKG